MKSIGECQTIALLIPNLKASYRREQATSPNNRQLIFCLQFKQVISASGYYVAKSS